MTLITYEFETALGHEDLLAIYERMLLARLLDERMWLLNRQGKVPFVISCQGHEAAQVGAAYALRPGHDWALPYYRDLGVVLSLGMTPEEVMLGVFARAADPSSGGRQMPGHYGHRALKIISQSSPTGTQAAHAAGVALAITIRNRSAGRVVDDAVVYVSFGEGASSQGDIHEAMNLAGAQRLPVIFVCENNGYAISTPAVRQSGVDDLSVRAAGYGFPGVTVDGMDPLACHAAMAEAVARARAGHGPTLLEFKVQRFTAHSSDDNDRTYRPAAELATLRESDPLPRFAARLREAGLLDELEEQQLRLRLRAEVDAAARAAEAAPAPEPATLRRFVYAEERA